MRIAEMIPRKPGWWILAIVLWLLGPSVAPAWSGPWPFPDRSPSQGDRPAPSAKAARAQLDGLRVPFVANDGRFDAQVAYYVPGAGSAFFVTHQGELVYALRRQDPDRPRAKADGRRARSEMRRSKSRASARGWALTEVLVDGQVRLVGQDRGVTGVSDFRGNDPARWRSGLPTYQAVGLGEVWPGVTVALQARGSRIEKIFTVQPGGSVDRIRVHVKGARALSLSADGALVARTGVGDVAFTAPVAYQERAGLRQPVSVSYRLEGRRYGFTVGVYDPALPLVIDPLLQSTFLGGDDDDFVYAIAIHPTTGDVYVTGETSSFDFPGTGGGAFEELATYFGFVTVDGFVARLNASLTVLRQATYFGGDGSDISFAIAIDPGSGDVYVAGRTDSSDFPTAGAPVQAAPAGGDDAFIARFSSDLKTLVAATYFGGTGDDEANALAIRATDDEVQVYIAGTTDSVDLLDLLGTGGAAQSGLGGGFGADAFVARLTGDLGITRVTYLGGSDDDTGFALAIAPGGDAIYVAGETFSTDFPSVTPDSAQPSLNDGGCGCAVDVYVARLTSDLTEIEQATYLGGSARDEANALAIHPGTGDVYVAGRTLSGNFPGTTGAQALPGGGDDAYVARLPGTLQGPIVATYLGGDDDDVAWGVAIHPATGDVYVAGGTVSLNFPATLGGVQESFGESFGGCDSDMFIARLSKDLNSIFQATYLGDVGCDEALALAISPFTGDVYVAGQTEGPFPGTEDGAQAVFGGFFSDGVVARLTRSLAAIEPDLAITKTHVGNFLRGQIGATYTITVTNVGTAPTDGTEVTVTDVVPGDLTPTALGGSGWSCELAARRCTRSDVLDPSASHPAITLTVDVATTAANLVTNTAVVSGGGDVTPDNNTASNPTTIVSAPDLTITKTHVGSFFQGQVGATYTITVSNMGTVATAGPVTVTDAVPAGFTPTALGGSGWDCMVATRTCTRNEALDPAASYPAITLTVEVATTAPSPLTNTAVVSGGGDADPGNNTANDVTTIVAKPDLTITKTHVGDFLQGHVGAAYTITVINVGMGTTDGTPVTVTDTVPAGLTPTALGGSGWDCTVATRTCTRSTALGPAASYPPITLTVDVAGNASSPLTNTVTVSGGGDVTPGNNTANDPTTIVAKPDLTITKTHAGNFLHGQVGATYTITVSNVGTAATDGTPVTVTDTVPAGLTPTALGGSGWDCSVATRTCTRSDALGAGAIYPAITLTVDVAGNASSPLTNTAVVSGGGDATPGNNTTNDLTLIGLAPDLTITKTHVGDFTRGQVGAIYTMSVRNVGTSATAGTVTVTETLPTGLTATALGGAGWSCSVGTVTCTRGDALAHGSSYPAITLTVSVAGHAPGSVTNTATVSGGGDVTPGNDTAHDPTTIVFVDVPTSHPFFPWVEALVAAGITGGCSISPPQYCPDVPVTRGQMAVFLLRGIHGGAYQPPAATGTIFVDVPLSHPLATWIEQLEREGITGGCSASPLRYCPDAGVTRAQMAVFLLRARHGAAYQPPAATGLFTDVPVSHPLASWIEQLAHEGITAGCGPSTYCPDAIVTREQMAVLLVRTFDLPI